VSDEGESIGIGYVRKDGNMFGFSFDNTSMYKWLILNDGPLDILEGGATYV